MAVTIGEILETPGTSLRLAGGRAGIGNAVRWVHVSELEDPTPWLKGGELLLTTGMGLGNTAARQRAYMERLTEAGLAGLGLGTGFSYKRVPKAIEREADRLAFPLFEVPFDTPFIAITEAVFTRLGGEQVTALRRALETQALLTDSALRDGMNGVVAALAKAVAGWAVVLDLHGLPVAASPSSAANRAATLWDEIRVARPDSPRFSLSMLDGHKRMSAQPIGVGGRVEAVLVLGTKDSLGQLEGIVASHAVSLLAIEFDKTASVATAERTAKGDFLEALVAGDLGDDEAAEGLSRFGFVPGEPVQVVALDGAAPVVDRSWAVEDVLSRRTQAFLTSPRGDNLIVLVPQSVDIGEVRAEASAKLSSPLVAGVGSAGPATDASRGLREAMHALRVCTLDGTPIADFKSLGTYRLLLSLQDPHALEAFVEAVLRPLDEYDSQHGGELIPSLHSFLEHNARWESAAAELLVHRHTLRYRMRKVEELTGRDLDSARDRMEFWLALQARELRVSS
ncbi:MAG: PucR family transcriptional regulator [Actinomycetota bacterium]